MTHYTARTVPIVTAQALAMRLHDGQTDKLGRPYIEHCAAVVAILKRRWPESTATEIAAAWLHDVLEDTEATTDSLETAGVDDEVVGLLWQLMRRKGLAYADYITRLTDGSTSALRIKLADLEHNCDPARCIPGSNLVEKRYRPAQAVLEAELVRREQSA